MKHQARQCLKVAEAEGAGIAPGPGAVLERAEKIKELLLMFREAPGDERQRLPVDGYGRECPRTQSLAISASVDRESRSFRPKEAEFFQLPCASL